MICEIEFADVKLGKGVSEMNIHLQFLDLMEVIGQLWPLFFRNTAEEQQR